MPSNPNPQKLKEDGMDAAFNPPSPDGHAIMNAIAGYFNKGSPSPQPSPVTPGEACPHCGQAAPAEDPDAVPIRDGILNK